MNPPATPEEERALIVAYLRNRVATQHKVEVDTLLMDVAHAIENTCHHSYKGKDACVCGHPKTAHSGLGGKRWAVQDGSGACVNCPCGAFRVPR